MLIMRVTGSLASVALTALVLPSHALAQHPVPGPLVTDRPDQTESASIVPRGLVQIEAGWALDHTAERSHSIRTHSVPGVLVRAGITDRFEARFGFAGWQAADTAGARGAASALGDTEVGVKALLRDAESGGPTIALIAHVTLPTGSGEATTGRPDPSVLITIAHGLSENVSLGWNAGPAWATAGTPGARETLLGMVGTASLGFGLTDRWSAFVEVFGVAATSDAGDSVGSVDGGVTLRLSDNLQFDSSLGLGVVGPAPDWSIASGVSIRLPR